MNNASASAVRRNASSNRCLAGQNLSALQEISALPHECGAGVSAVGVSGRTVLACTRTRARGPRISSAYSPALGSKLTTQPPWSRGEARRLPCRGLRDRQPTPPAPRFARPRRGGAPSCEAERSERGGCGGWGPKGMARPSEARRGGGGGWGPKGGANPFRVPISESQLVGRVSLENSVANQYLGPAENRNGDAPVKSRTSSDVEAQVGITAD